MTAAVSVLSVLMRDTVRWRLSFESSAILLSLLLKANGDQPIRPLSHAYSQSSVTLFKSARAHLFAERAICMELCIFGFLDSVVYKTTRRDDKISIMQ